MLAGGAVLKGAWGLATSANLTPDASGISYYTEATFITAVRTGLAPAVSAAFVSALVTAAAGVVAGISSAARV